ncbi:putative heme d1 biosynthesis radical SAM protein NirJ2 [Natranaerobius thermophilus]|uniref:Radical SAM domain protein n=1 Tax=Natranaerobius thermophilus (strain ATCC BAA-1301 / DSM 18059 / JW/NM-WN-LF) TaxID=457570 RepID=B2A1H1_NATTJ|nr:putative heme d1 biosynthesis radical SAM protein NirJ2 [Natranaerobius thermophilus]ACB84711.1 Radical SAM domain protein [Natranaerobius thermophilus JW/NM-WN-LF]
MLVSWNTTKSCHLNCKHCYRDAGEADSRELTTEEGKKLLDEIKTAGFKLIIFSGGEPLERQDIYKLVSYAKKIGLRPVLGTSGTTITRKVARKLKEAGAVRLGISLDSVHPEVHDDFRQTPGSFDDALTGIKNCLAEGLDFQIHTTIVEQNYHEFEELTEFAVELGAKAHHIFFLVPTGRAKDIETEGVRQKRYEQLLHRIIDKQSEVDIELKPTCAPQFMRIAHMKGIDMRFTRGCLAGTSYCCITPNGDVNPCPYLPHKVGNVLETPFDEIWKNSELLNELRTMDLEGKCGNCNYLEYCSGCRARAYYYNGNYMAEDPWCLYKNN